MFPRNVVEKFAHPRFSRSTLFRKLCTSEWQVSEPARSGIQMRTNSLLVYFEMGGRFSEIYSAPHSWKRTSSLASEAAFL
jgi:hypothetical protein